ncbi:MAG: L,D-transpeptidase [Chloroflexi bacterium]|nr:L,D-transpeptidase [Chloroflexota bacterium]
MISCRSLLTVISKSTLVLMVVNLPSRLIYARHSVVPAPLTQLRLTVDYVLDSSPTISSQSSLVLPANTVLPIIEQVMGTTYGKNNNVVWFCTMGGDVHSSYVQLVDNRPNVPVLVTDAHAKFGAEVTVLYVGILAQPNRSAKVNYSAYYSSVYRVVDVVQTANEWWYRISDGVRGGGYMPAYPLWHFALAGLASISANINAANKRLDVDLCTHLVMVFEHNRAVYQAKCVSGERVANKYTSAGSYSIIQKVITTHMRGAQGRADAYDLPSVPFLNYFTNLGIAFHESYCHFDRGACRTHGCINLSGADALEVAPEHPTCQCGGGAVICYPQPPRHIGTWGVIHDIDK